jgi:hypothetical protein
LQTGLHRGGLPYDSFLVFYQLPGRVTSAGHDLPEFHHFFYFDQAFSSIFHNNLIVLGFSISCLSSR